MMSRSFGVAVAATNSKISTLYLPEFGKGAVKILIKYTDQERHQEEIKWAIEAQNLCCPRGLARPHAHVHTLPAAASPAISGGLLSAWRGTVRCAA